MLQSIFRNMQPVVKNLLIVNVLFFLATFVFEKQDIYLAGYLGLFYVDSPMFMPLQIATHFFMHAGLGHIFLNMFGLVIFGNLLEQSWGAKRFLIFYFVTALGAALLHQVVMGFEIYQLTGTFFPFSNEVRGTTIEINQVMKLLYSPAVGASGAIYGLMAAVAVLHPNTTVYLYFAIPIKMKWLALGLAVFAIYMGMANTEGDSVAHFAHLGGMLFGYIIVKTWQKNSKNFY